MQLEELCTIQESAALLKVSTWTLRSWISRGKHDIRTKRAGRRILIERSALREFIEASTAATETRKETR